MGCHFLSGGSSPLGDRTCVSFITGSVFITVPPGKTGAILRAIQRGGSAGGELGSPSVFNQLCFCPHFCPMTVNNCFSLSGDSALEHEGNAVPFTQVESNLHVYKWKRLFLPSILHSSFFYFFQNAEECYFLFCFYKRLKKKKKTRILKSCVYLSLVILLRPPM